MGWRNTALGALEELEQRTALLRQELTRPERGEGRSAPIKVAHQAMRALYEAHLLWDTAWEMCDDQPLTESAQLQFAVIRGFDPDLERASKLLEQMSQAWEEKRDDR